MKERTGAVILAAGQGKRMHANVAKQFMELGGCPMIVHSLRAFEHSDAVDEIVLVTGEDQIEYCRREIVEAFGFSKVKAVIPGGKERYHSVYEGLKELKRSGQIEYVLIHDGARPLVTEAVIARAAAGAKTFKACVVGMPVKDTIKFCDEEGYGAGTPDRSRLWQIQTPQAFALPLIEEAYRRILSRPEGQDKITDDAMVVEAETDCRVKLIQGDYRNIKVTTPEDILIAEAFLAAEGAKS